ncbi:MAG TPA: hypothetical protein VMJ64_14060, partial [Anaerolineales bacterium]|nr:hypothetical protein [Anaerolineales bacterium]
CLQVSRAGCNHKGLVVYFAGHGSDHSDRAERQKVGVEVVGCPSFYTLPLLLTCSGNVTVW